MRATTADYFPFYYTTAIFFGASVAGFAVDIMDFLKTTAFAENISVVGH